jgi:hypothetical protein
MLISVCMFCKAEYGRKPGRGVSGVSDGVCPACEPFALRWLEEGVGASVSMPLSDRGVEVACEVR